MKLNVKAIESIIKEVAQTGKTRKTSDGGGLYLEVTASGGTYWRMKYRFMGKEKRLALGVYPQVSLAEARDKRYHARKQLENGIDPNEQKKKTKLERIKDYENNFEALAREWHQNRQHAWQPKHAENILEHFHNLPTVYEVML